ncbi:hypothetical protein [Lutibacter sp.]|uniref:hypothetical protein n=1 Tax=Lutibacter sp. TaxID=1925666 RepID=UPI003562B41E
MKPQIDYIGRKITIKAIRDYILDYELSENDTILLHPTNFDDIVLEYRETFSESINLPYFLLKVWISESFNYTIPHGRIGIIKNDKDPNRPCNNLSNEDFLEQDKSFDFLDGEVVYRCNWCGNIVDAKGIPLNGYERDRIIDYLQNYDNPIVEHKNGECCPEKAINS